MYNYARHCASIQSYQDAKEVLLFNKDQFIMDGSITTPYFFRDGKWITPHMECGGQQGTTRRWAIDQGFCNAGFVSRESLRSNEIIWLSNGVKGFFTARVLVADDGISRSPSHDSRSSSGFSEASKTSSRSSIALHNLNMQTHDEGNGEEQDCEDDIEEVRRKYPPAKDADAFRKSAFALDVFEKGFKL